MELERSRSLRYNRPFTLAYIDVDGLRLVNEDEGDASEHLVLQLITRTIRETVRSMDTVARLASDEFALLLPETGSGSAEVALSEIKSRLDEVVDAHRFRSPSAWAPSYAWARRHPSTA